MATNQSQYEEMCEVYERYNKGDLVPVVRCKDCVYAARVYWGHIVCTANSEPNLFCKTEDYFCAWGRRKDNG